MHKPVIGADDSLVKPRMADHGYYRDPIIVARYLRLTSITFDDQLQSHGAGLFNILV